MQVKRKRQILYLMYQHNEIPEKSFQQFNQVIIIMGAHIKHIKLMTTTKLKLFCLDLPKDTCSNLTN